MAEPQINANGARTKSAFEVTASEGVAASEVEKVISNASAEVV